MDMQQLKESCDNCRKCALCEGRTNVVFGTGNPKAEILFIGEAPGKNEDLTGTPFVGRAGQLLDRYLEAIGLKRDRDVYIANILKCRPPNNRDPLPEEQDMCIEYLRRQTVLIKPKIIVCLGRIAAKRIIREDFAVTKEHGLWVKKGDFELMGTFHPAALLRNPANNQLALEDFLSLKEKIKEVCTNTIV